MSKHIARKHFGQHFLCDGHVIARIVESIAPVASDLMIEIGPGLSAITNVLVKNLPQLTVVEIDRDLVKRLRANEKLLVVESDALKVDFPRLAKDMIAKNNQAASTKIRIVGNLPYNISTPLLFHLMDAANYVQDQHFMLQKEVVDRMVATPCTKNFGRLSVMLQWRYDMKSLFDVPPECFDPPPKVQSSIVQMTPRPSPVPIDTALLEELVRVAFSQRRKLLRHTLGKWLDERRFSGHFDLQRRAEEVSTVEYLTLAQALP